MEPCSTTDAGCLVDRDALDEELVSWLESCLKVQSERALIDRTLLLYGPSGVGKRTRVRRAAQGRAWKLLSVHVSTFLLNDAITSAVEHLRGLLHRVANDVLLIEDVDWLVDDAQRADWLGLHHSDTLHNQNGVAGSLSTRERTLVADACLAGQEPLMKRCLWATLISEMRWLGTTDGVSKGPGALVVTAKAPLAGFPCAHPVHLPNWRQRKQYLERLRGSAALADITPGYTYAELRLLVLSVEARHHRVRTHESADEKTPSSVSATEQQAFSHRDTAPGKNEPTPGLTPASRSVPAGKHQHDSSGDANSFEYAGGDCEGDVDASDQRLVCCQRVDHHQRLASASVRAGEENRSVSIAIPQESERPRSASDQITVDSKEVTLRALWHPPETVQPDGRDILAQDMTLTLSDIPAPAIVRQVGALRWWRSPKPRGMDPLFGQSVREAHRMVRRALMAHMDEENHSGTLQQRGNILGVLLHGPSGNGKTLFAEMLAHPWRDPEQHRDWPALNLIPIQAADIVSARVGEAERAMRSVLTVCESMGNCVLFIDHIEMLTPARDTLLEAGGVHERVLSLLLQYLDGFYARQGRRFGFVVATDAPHVLDRALLRPGRLDIQVLLSAPDAEARQEAIEYHLCRSIRSITLPSRLRATSTALVASTSGQSMAAVRQAASDLVWNLVGGLDTLLQSK